MTVSSGTHSYKIMHKFASRRFCAAYIARDEKLPILLIKITDPDTARGVEVYFTSLLQAPGFRDLRDVFRCGSDLYLAFVYVQYSNSELIARVSDGLTRRERNELAHKLMSAIAASGMPWPVLCDVLAAGNIFCSGGKIGFIYRLDIFPGYERDCRASAMAKLAAILETIYEGADYPSIGVFIDKLRNMQFEDMHGILKEFANLCQSIRQLPEPPAPVRPTLWKRLRTLAVKIVQNSAALLATALLIAGYVYLAYSTYITLTQIPQSGKLESIGTVAIKAVTENE